MIRVCVRVRVSVGLGSVLLTDMDKCKIMVMHDYGKVIDTVVVRVRATAIGLTLSNTPTRSN